MSIGTLVLGESGTGKTASLRNLDPSKTLLIQSIKKPLPFRSSAWKYKVAGQAGNVFVTDQSNEIIALMQKTSRKVIVIDDFQYVLANAFMRRVTDNEVGNSAFQKYNEIAKSAWEIMMAATALPDDVRVYILSHTSTDDFGKTKMKLIGRLLEEKIVMEGLVTIVMRTVVQNGNYLFSTRNSGSDTVKSPIGLFDSEVIPNDLAEVDAAIYAYYDMKPAAPVAVVQPAAA